MVAVRSLDGNFACKLRHDTSSSRCFSELVSAACILYRSSCSRDRAVRVFLFPRVTAGRQPTVAMVQNVKRGRKTKHNLETYYQYFNREDQERAVSLGSGRGQLSPCVCIAPELLVEIGHPASESRDVGFKLCLLALRFGECGSQAD